MAEVTQKKNQKKGEIWLSIRELKKNSDNRHLAPAAVWFIHLHYFK